MSIESMTANISDEERQKMIEQMTGQKLDGKVDYVSFEMLTSNEVFNLKKREQAKEEILAYMLEQIKAEFHISDNGEALLKWDEYKAKHEITSLKINGGGE